MGTMRTGGQGALYGGKPRLSNMRVHHWLWVLVILEMLTIVGLRILFGRYHGG